MSNHFETDRDSATFGIVGQAPWRGGNCRGPVMARDVSVDVLVRRLPKVTLLSPATPHGAVLTLVRDRTSAAVVAAGVGADAPTPEAMVSMFEHVEHPGIVALWTCPVRPAGIVVGDDLLWSAGMAAEWSRAHGVRIDHPDMWPQGRREPDAWMDRSCREIVAAVARGKPPRDPGGSMTVSVEVLARVAAAWRSDVERRPWAVTGLVPGERWQAAMAALKGETTPDPEADPAAPPDRAP